MNCIGVGELRIRLLVVLVWLHIALGNFLPIDQEYEVGFGEYIGVGNSVVDVLLVQIHIGCFVHQAELV